MIWLFCAQAKFKVINLSQKGLFSAAPRHYFIIAAINSQWRTRKVNEDEREKEKRVKNGRKIKRSARFGKRQCNKTCIWSHARSRSSGWHLIQEKTEIFDPTWKKCLLHKMWQIGCHDVPFFGWRFFTHSIFFSWKNLLFFGWIIFSVFILSDE